MKKFIITEEEKNRILKLHKNRIIQEQSTPLAGGTKDIHPDDWMSQGLEGETQNTTKSGLSSDLDKVKKDLEDLAKDFPHKRKTPVVNTNDTKVEPKDEELVTLDTIANALRKKGYKINMSNPNYDFVAKLGRSSTASMGKDKVFRIDKNVMSVGNIKSFMYTIDLKEVPYKMTVETNKQGKQSVIKSARLIPSSFMDFLKNFDANDPQP